MQSFLILVRHLTRSSTTDLPLNHYGVRGNTLAWIQNFLSHRSKQVVVDGEKSEPASVTPGVPQGTVLVPFLFLVHINDLPSTVNSPARLFANDFLLYRVNRRPADIADIAAGLRSPATMGGNMADDFQPWEMWGHPHHQQAENHRRLIHGYTLLLTYKVKYLGFTTDTKLSWGHHTNIMTKKANNTTAFLRRNLSSCPRNIRATCYKSLVRPQIEYASTVWDHSNKTHIKAVEAVQRRAARFITGNYRQESSVTSMLQDLQLESLQERRFKARATLMYRVVYNVMDLSPEPLLPTSVTTRGHSQRFLQPFCYIKSFQDSFYPSGIIIWNSLPQNIVSADSLRVFQDHNQHPHIHLEHSVFIRVLNEPTLTWF